MSNSDGDDFEVVPQAPDDDDGDVWDVEDENEDEVKQDKIKSMPILALSSCTNILTLCVTYHF